jgi:hypothetical protein
MRRIAVLDDDRSLIHPECFEAMHHQPPWPATWVNLRWQGTARRGYYADGEAAL